VPRPRSSEGQKVGKKITLKKFLYSPQQELYASFEREPQKYQRVKKKGPEDTG